MGRRSSSKKTVKPSRYNGYRGQKAKQGKVGVTTLKIVSLAVLVAIMILLEVTGLGLIRTAGFEITLLLIPMLVGAIVLGPVSGAILGGVFGFISFWSGISGTSPFGVILFGINPIYFFILTFVTRVLVGLLCGLVFRGLRHVMSKGRIVPFAVAGMSAAILNTVLFMLALILLFADFFSGMQGDVPLFPFLVGFVGLNGLIEAGVSIVVGTTISRAVYNFVNR